MQANGHIVPCNKFVSCAGVEKEMHFEKLYNITAEPKKSWNSLPGEKTILFVNESSMREITDFESTGNPEEVIKIEDVLEDDTRAEGIMAQQHCLIDYWYMIMSMEEPLQEIMKFFLQTSLSTKDLVAFEVKRISLKMIRGKG
jgi:hypothetical protein